MTTRERAILSAQLAGVDRRRAELECMMMTLPPDYREDLEVGAARPLGLPRVKLAEQLNSYPERGRCGAMGPSHQRGEL
jgi:hypothetical protein